jgi:hypothetical protein
MQSNQTPTDLRAELASLRRINADLVAVVDHILRLPSACLDMQRAHIDPNSISLTHSGPVNTSPTVFEAARNVLQRAADNSLLRSVNEPLPDGCGCQPGKCMAPKIMGRQMPCRDPQKAATARAVSA